MKTVGYARLSPTNEDDSQQLRALTEAGCATIFRDTATGVRSERPGLTAALRAVREGDMLVVWKLSRLGRSLTFMVGIVCELEARGVGLRSLTEGIDTTAPAGPAAFRFFGALRQFENDLIRERTRAGLAAAMARGQAGRKPVITDAKLQQAQALIAGGLTVRETATRIQVGKTALYSALRATADEPDD